MRVNICAFIICHERATWLTFIVSFRLHSVFRGNSFGFSSRHSLWILVFSLFFSWIELLFLFSFFFSSTSVRCMSVWHDMCIVKMKIRKRATCNATLLKHWSIVVEDPPTYNSEQCQGLTRSCNVLRVFEFEVVVVWPVDRHRVSSSVWHASSRRERRREYDWAQHGNELRHDSRNVADVLDRWIEESEADVWHISPWIYHLRCETLHTWIQKDNDIYQLNWQYEWCPMHGDHRGFSMFDCHQDTGSRPRAPNNRTIWSVVSLADWPCPTKAPLRMKSVRFFYYDDIGWFIGNCVITVYSRHDHSRLLFTARKRLQARSRRLGNASENARRKKRCQ